jgi:tyrosine-protein phosphatase-like protein OCA2
VTAALEILLDVRNFPVLVHSNKGKHRVGVLVGVMKKMLLGWSLAAIFDDYSKFAGGKGEADMEVS